MKGVANKRRKRETEDESAETTVDWKQRCIQDFDLVSIPPSLSFVYQDDNDTWKGYHEHRSRFKEETNSLLEDSDNLLEEWEDELQGLVNEIVDEYEENGTDEKDNDKPEVPLVDSWPNHTHLSLPSCCVDENEELRSATFKGRVWSPYAVPHCIVLKHSYHYRARYSSLEFYSSFEYDILDLSEGTTTNMKKLCSVCFEDEELRLDVIDDRNMTPGTIQSMLRHLYGKSTEATKGKNSNKTNVAGCSDFEFAQLLFGSMGVFDFSTLKAPYSGYEWDPTDDADVKELGISFDSSDEWASNYVSWLEHAMRKATGALRPFDPYFKQPNIKDAPGYNRYEMDEDGGDY